MPENSWRGGCSEVGGWVGDRTFLSESESEKGSEGRPVARLSKF